MSDDDRLRRVEALVRLSHLDWGYADLYLRDAERELRSIFTPAEFQDLALQRKSISAVIADARWAVQRDDWQEAERLAGEALAIQQKLKDQSRLLTIGEDVYGSRNLSPDPVALALAGAVAHPVAPQRSRIQEITKTLRSLVPDDPGSDSFYGRRAAQFEHLEFDSEEAAAAGSDPAELSAAAIAAVDAGDLHELIRLARGARKTGHDRSGRVHAPRPTSAWVERLADAFPTQAVDRAAALGLEPFAVPARPELNAYLSCACVDQPTLPEAPLDAAHREAEGCTCGHACPPGVSSNLKSSLDLLMVHAFVTSGGTRYLPWFGPEAVLVECFPEDGSEPVTGLLQAVGLPQRRGLPRLVIEDALLRRGPALCEELGLAPEDYCVACIPFDVYSRLAADLSWGHKELWTHFDGYQVTRELRLQALVGGDVRFGGPDDLCAVARHYDSDRITVRFALVRRERFAARMHRA